MRVVFLGILLGVLLMLASCDFVIDPSNIEVTGFIIGGTDDWDDCQYDSDCESICEGNVAWKQGCNPRIGECFKTFDYDCDEQVEVFGEFEFPKRCSQGECVRDEQAIRATKRELEAQIDGLREEYAELSGVRAEIIARKDEAHRNCMRGLSDATAILIVEMATRQAGLVAGAAAFVKDSGARAVDWLTPVPDFIAEGLDRAAGGGRLSLEEYIAINCGLNDYLGELLDDSDAMVDEYVRLRREAQDALNALP